MRVIITGGAGFIGYHLTRELIKQGHDVTVFDDFSGVGSERIFEVKDVTVVKGDVSSTSELCECCRKADAIYHLAAQTNVAHSMQEPEDDMQTNLKGTVNVLEVARHEGAKLVFTSTAAVYGQPVINPIPETHSLRPISFYGLSKKAAEDYCRMYHENFGIPCTIMRIFNCYGSHCHGVVSDVIRRLRGSMTKLTVLGKPEWAKDFVYVSDVVRALSKALEFDSSSELRVFNVGSGHATKLKDLVEEICRNAGFAPNLYFTGESWPGDITDLHADITIIRDVLGWKPEVPLFAGLSETFRWFRLEQQGLEPEVKVVV